MRTFFLALLILINITASAQLSKWYKNNQTPTYKELIDAYKQLADSFPAVTIKPAGKTDSGEPLFLVTIDAGEDLTISGGEGNEKVKILINNGIHPGEPCGVDASLKLAEDLIKEKRFQPLLENVVLYIIPLYNVGGALNRNCCSRTNQNGPEMYGFRGNAKNLDLNRDFIKTDSKNAESFARIFHRVNPDVFIDTHTSNGADYQHTMTLITTQKDKLEPSLAKYVTTYMEPALYKSMELKKQSMVPYVHTRKQIPDDGIVGYLETPRYSTGYTALFNTIGFVSEAHMLKTFEERVEATYDFLLTITEFCNKNNKEIKQARQQAIDNTTQQMEFPIQWELDTTTFDKVKFNGYKAEYPTSKVTGKPRLYYSHTKPWTKEINYYNNYKATAVVTKPAYYIIPQAWEAVINRLLDNRVKMYELSADVTVKAEMYSIVDYKTPDKPYEGHYLHTKVQVQADTVEMNYRKGDYVIKTDQKSNRYIVETLEPHAVDAFFSWNFFDPILQQKEWFSAYVFEAEAEKLLEEDYLLRKNFEDKKAKDKAFAENSFMQLYYIYKNSPHYEPTHNLYPVGRVGDIELPIDRKRVKQERDKDRQREKEGREKMKEDRR